MIGRISGRVAQKNANRLLIDNGGISYEVLIPPTVMQRLGEDLALGSDIELVTYHYYQVEPSRSTPVLIGFLNEVEKDFFETFITVSGIGPRAAVKALNQPISLIAKAIDEADTRFLTSLPGIGQQRAKEIIAKLQSRIGKFALIQDGLSGKKDTQVSTNFVDEAVAVLMQLEYKKQEAEAMVKKALQRAGNIASTEELLNEVYRQKKDK